MKFKMLAIAGLLFITSKCFSQVLPESRAVDNFVKNASQNAALNAVNKSNAHKKGVTYYNTGVEEIERGRDQEAIQYFTAAMNSLKFAKAKKIEIDNCNLYLAIAYSNLSDKGYALKHLYQISNNKIKDRDLAYMTGTLFKKLKEYPEAERYLLFSIKADKYFKDGYDELIDLYTLTNQPEKKLQMLNNLQKVNL